MLKIFTACYIVWGASQVMLVVKNLSANAGDIRDSCSITGLGRSPGGGHDNPLQYSCRENHTDRGAWQASVHRVMKSWTRLKRISTASIWSNMNLNVTVKVFPADVNICNHLILSKGDCPQYNKVFGLRPITWRSLRQKLRYAEQESILPPRPPKFLNCQSSL